MADKCAPANDLARHRRLRDINESFATEGVNLNAQLVHHELARFSACEPVPSNDRRWMNASLDKLVRTAQEFSSDDHHRGRPVAYFFVLLLCEIDEYSAGWVLDF